MAWPRIGITTISPRKNGIEPITRPAATIRPQTAIGTGLAAATRIEVITATGRPTSRSRSSGKDTTLKASTSAAKRKPTAMPTIIIVQPAPVVKTSRAKPPIEAGATSPKVAK